MNTQKNIKRRLKPTKSTQHGAALITTAFVMVLLVGLLGLGLETGQLYYAQRDLEKLASVAALDAARVASGCARAAGQIGNGVPKDQAQAMAEVMASIARNNLSGSPLSDPVVELGATNDLNSQSPNGTGKRKFVVLPAGSPEIDSVRVTLSRPRPAILFPTLFGAAGPALFASATARQGASGSFTVGSNLLKVNGGLLNQTLGALLCKAGDTACMNSILALSLLDSQTGLATATVSLGQLALAAGVSVADLSNPLTVTTAPVLLNGLATQLAGSAGGAVSTLLRNLATASTNPGSVPLGQLLGAVDNIATNVPVANLLDLIMALGVAANANSSGGIQPIQLPLNLNVLGVTANTYIKILEPPQPAAGRPGSPIAVAHTAQVVVQVRIDTGTLVNNLVTALTPILGLALKNPVIVSKIGIDVAVAPASASLTRLQCPVPDINGGFPVAGLNAVTGIASVQIGTYSGAPGSGTPVTPAGSVPLLSGLIQIPIVGSANLNVALGTTTSVAVGSGGGPLTDVTKWTLNTKNPDGSPLSAGKIRSYTAAGATAPDVSDNPQDIPSQGSLGATVVLTQPIISNSTGVLALLQPILNAVVSLVTSVINPLVAAINGIIVGTVNPLLQILGASVGTGTVRMVGAQIGQPEIVSTCLPAATGPGC